MYCNYHNFMIEYRQLKKASTTDAEPWELNKRILSCMISLERRACTADSVTDWKHKEQAITPEKILSSTGYWNRYKRIDQKRIPDKKQVFSKQEKRINESHYQTIKTGGYENMKIEIGKKCIFTPSPYMQGRTCYVPEPIHGVITEIRYRSPINRKIELIIITDKKGKQYKAFEHQIVSRLPAVYNFIWKQKKIRFSCFEDIEKNILKKNII